MSISAEAFLVGFNEAYLDQGPGSYAKYDELNFGNKYTDGYQAGTLKRDAEKEMAKPLVICNNCRREVKVGHRVIPTWILEEAPEKVGYEGKLNEVRYDHANCYGKDVDGPQYDESGRVFG